MSSTDPLAAILRELDGPVRPRAEFAEALLTLLEGELAEPDGRVGRGRGSGIRRPFARRGRRWLVVAVAVLVLCAVAAATYVAARLWSGQDPQLRQRATPALAARGAEREPIRIDVSGGPQGGNPNGGGGTFTLLLGSAHDDGSVSYSVVFTGSGTTPDGQPYARFRTTMYLTGARGSLVLTARGASLGATGTGAVDGQDVWQGAWELDSGTGAYRGLRGDGALVGIAGPGARVALRLQGTAD